MEEIKIKKFILLDENLQNNYELTIALKKDSIELISLNTKETSGLLYQNEFTHEKLCEYSIFKLYNNINEDFNKFFYKFKQENIIISLENKNISVSFKYQILDSPEEAKFILSPKKLKNEDIAYLIRQKNNEINILKQRINDLEKENELLKSNEKLGLLFCQKLSEINELNKGINNQKEKDLLFKKVEMLYGHQFDFDYDEFKILYDEIKKYSNIIGYGKDLELILRGIKKTVNKKVSKITLLYKVSQHGDSASNFHSFCDGKENTLTLSITDKNRRFGGFTTVKWDQSSSYKTDSQAFIFSLDNSEIYYAKNSNPQYAIYCDPNFGPIFGSGHDFYIQNKSTGYENSGSYYDTKGKKYCLSGENNFKVLDYEVFQIEFS